MFLVYCATQYKNLRLQCFENATNLTVEIRGLMTKKFYAISSA